MYTYVSVKSINYMSVSKLRDILFGPPCINTLRPRQNGHRFADDTFKRILLNENVRISIKISLKFVPKGPINNIPALFQIMAWRRSVDKPLSEPMMVSLLTHICVTRPQWVNEPLWGVWARPPSNNKLSMSLNYSRLQTSSHLVPICPNTWSSSTSGFQLHIHNCK